MLTVNALTTANTVLVPIQCEYYALEGLSQLIYTINLVQERLNPNLKLSGVIITRYEKNRLSEMYLDKIKTELGAAVLMPVIHKATKIAQAASFGQNIYDYDPDGKATREYLEIAQKLALRVMGED